MQKFLGGGGAASSSTQKSKKRTLPEDLQPWVEKYRPKSVDDIVYQDEVVGTLRQSLETGNLPHLLFYGPPGTGKTSTILAMARQLYGPELFKDRVRELNASDERGIDVVRHKIKDFARIAVGSQGSKGYPCPPFKIIILDEADAMTTDAQNALRRTMETFSGVTRFCLICNYVSRIIEPIASRCAKFRFRPLKEELISERLRLIAQTEKVPCTDDVIARLTQVSGGDLRKAITFLQSSHRLFGSLPSGVQTKHIDDIAGIIPDSKIAELFQVIRSCDFQKLQRFVEDLIADGFPIAVLLGQINDELVKPSNSAADVLGPLDGVAKAHISDCIAQADKALIDGADEALQLMAVAGFIMRVVQTDGKADLPKTSISV